MAGFRTGLAYARSPNPVIVWAPLLSLRDETTPLTRIGSQLTNRAGAQRRQAEPSV